jgi:hypothetical protein
MRVRGNHIAVIVLGLLMTIIVAVILQSGHPVMSAPGVTTAGATGGVPAVGTDQTAMPKIEASTTNFDLGEISNRDVGKGDIALFNKGKVPLKLVPQVSTTCGCTTGRFDDGVESIPPGGQVTLHVQVDPMKMQGFSSEKVLTITSDDPITPRLEIIVKAHVKPEYALEPATFDFGKVSKGQAAERVMKVTQLTDEPLDLVKATQMGQRGVDVTYERVPEDKWKTPGKAEFLVTAKLNEGVVPGPINGSILLNTKYLRVPRISVTFSGLVDSFYALSSSNLSLRGMVGDADCGQLEVSAADPIELKDIEISNPDLFAQVKPSDKPNAAVIIIGSKPGTKSGVKRGDVSFTVASATQGSVKEKIQIVGFIRPSATVTALPSAEGPPAAAVKP